MVAGPLRELFHAASRCVSKKLPQLLQHSATADGTHRNGPPGKPQKAPKADNQDFKGDFSKDVKEMTLFPFGEDFPRVHRESCEKITNATGGGKNSPWKEVQKLGLIRKSVHRRNFYCCKDT